MRWTQAAAAAAAVGDKSAPFVPQVDVAAEMVNFANCLLELVQGDERTRHLVQLLWAPAAPFLFDVFCRTDLTAFDKLQAGNVQQEQEEREEK